MITKKFYIKHNLFKEAKYTVTKRYKSQYLVLPSYSFHEAVEDIQDIEDYTKLVTLTDEVCRNKCYTSGRDVIKH